MNHFKRRLEAIEKRVKAIHKPMARIIYYTPGEESHVPEDDGRECRATVFLPRNGREEQPLAMVNI